SCTSTQPSTVDGCAAANRLNAESTTRFAAQVAAAAAAGDRGDLTARDTAIDSVRATFKDWAAGLRTQAGAAKDTRLRRALHEYADAVDATIARIRTPADLDRLDSFDGQEIDRAASHFADVCG